jgi:beta-glucosidase
MTQLPDLRRRRLLQAAALSTAAALLPLDALAAAVARGLRGELPRDPLVEGLLAQMTLEEKAGQLNLLPDGSRPDGKAFNPAVMESTQGELLAAIKAGQVTGLFNGIGVEGARALQKVALEQSRLKIPLLFAGDIIHGLKTVFPVPLGEASAFDADLSERTARGAALEATAMGIQWTFAPMVDIARDQRWGRVVEGAGEDPYLGGLLAAARVRGFQGKDLRQPDTMLATLKHFAAYGAVGAGMDYNSADIPETTLRGVHLPPFHAGVEAGALSVMSSFNDIAGVPSTANHHLLTDILRDEWDFKGLVVSDWTSEQELIAHGYAADEKDAAKKSLLAGCDMSMTSGIYLKHLPALVREGAVPVAVLDRAVRRVLHVKKALGLFEDPYRSLDPAAAAQRVGTPAMVALAREAAQRSVVLLKNEGDLLPLRAQGQRIALVGPFGEDTDNLMGAWAIFADKSRGVSLAAGLRAALADASALETARGSDITAPIAGGIAAAVAAAQRADVVVLAVGEAEAMSGEAHSRVDIGIPAAQLALAEAVAATGKPVVVVLRHGRALALHGAVLDARAIVAGWFLGTETGHGLADILFGKASPSGRLPVSFPRESGQQPYFYNHRNTGRPQVSDKEVAYKARYDETPNEARFPFGHGLTYGRVDYGPTQLSSPSLRGGGALTVSATLTNRGQRAAREVAQLYLHQRVSALTRPVRELKGFQAVELQPGESRTVSFRVTPRDLKAIQPNLAFAAEPGAFEAVIAPNAAAGTLQGFRLEGARA